MTNNHQTNSNGYQFKPTTYDIGIQIGKRELPFDDIGLTDPVKIRQYLKYVRRQYNFLQEGPHGVKFVLLTRGFVPVQIPERQEDEEELEREINFFDYCATTTTGDEGQEGNDGEDIDPECIFSPEQIAAIEAKQQWEADQEHPF